MSETTYHCAACGMPLTFNFYFFRFIHQVATGNCTDTPIAVADTPSGAEPPSTSTSSEHT